MTAAKNAVRVVIGGEEFTVRSELPPEYTREVAAYLDAALKRVRDTMPMMETHKAAILAALAITDELFQARRGDREIASRLSGMADDLARLLPPAKRGSRAAVSGRRSGPGSIVTHRGCLRLSRAQAGFSALPSGLAATALGGVFRKTLRRLSHSSTFTP